MMLLKRERLTFIIATAVLVTLLLSSTVIFAQPQSQQSQSGGVHGLLEAAEGARERAYELRDLLIGEIGDVPEEAETLLEEGDTLLDEGGIQNAVKAMNRYRRAYRLMHRFLGDRGVDTDAPERGRGILVAIDRTYARIERWNNTLAAINETLTDVQYSEIEGYFECVLGNLSEAELDLVQANDSLWLDPPNIVWAAHNLTEANRDIHEALRCLKLIAKECNRWRMEDFLANVRGFRERVRERVWRKTHGMPGIFLEKWGYTDMEDFDQSIEGLIESAQDKVEDIKEAVQDLRAIMKRLREMEHHLPDHGGPP